MILRVRWRGGVFYYSNTDNRCISFRFSIKLHKNDKPSLEYLKYRLNTGIIVNGDNHVAYNISKISDINSILIPLLEKFPLNGVKYLDYLSFKSAISIKLDESFSKEEKLNLISSIKMSWILK